MQDKREHDPARDELIMHLEDPPGSGNRKRFDLRRFRPRLIRKRPCYKCKKIIWEFKTVNEKKTVVDAVPVVVHLADVTEGTNRLYDAAGRNTLHDVGDVGFLSHFATCPYAEAFRKDKRRSRPKQKPKQIPTPEEFRSRLRWNYTALENLAKGSSTIEAHLRHLAGYAQHTLEIFDRAADGSKPLSADGFHRRLIYVEHGLNKLQRAAGKTIRKAVRDLARHAKETREINERNRNIT